MAKPRLDGPLGDRLGPKLSQLVLQHTLAARKALGPLEARWRQLATQAVIDRAGHEVADLFGPISQEILAAEDRELHPHMRRHLEQVASGHDQWKSLLGNTQLAFAGAVGTTISNLVFPVTGAINLADRNTPVDPQTAAEAVAAGLATYGAGNETAGAYGLTGAAWQLLVELAAVIPDAGTLQQLVNRGLLTSERAEYWLNRAAVPQEMRAGILSLRRLLLTPADAALGLLRGDISQAEAHTIATDQGMQLADFNRLVLNTGEPPGAQQLAEAWRRSFIDKATFDRGIRQSRIRDEWLPVLEKLRYAPIPTADAIDAALRGWITEAQADAIAQQNGVLPDQVKILRDNAGNPPSNEQLLELRRRGKITDAQLVKGIREGRTRDEWIPQIKDLSTQPLGTADALDAWLRGHIDDAGLDQLLAENGLEEKDWPIAKGNAGNPLALMQLLEAFRRKFIDRATFIRGFRESRYRDEWASTALQLGHSPMSTADAVDVALQGWQTWEWAAGKAEENGLEAEDFPLLHKTAGEPLSRTELSQLYNRGEIDLATFRQGLRESRLRDEYVDQAIALRVRWPETFQVVRWVEYGLIDEKDCRKLLMQNGYTEQVANLLIAEGKVTATGPHKQLMATQVADLYSDRIIDQATARQLLEQLHYTEADAEMQLQLADFKLQQRILDSGIGMIRSHYLAGRVDDVTARADLTALRLPHSAVDLYLQTWGYDKLAHPKQLTEAQIVKAAKDNLLVPQAQLSNDDWTAANQLAGCERLVALGYSPDDAKLLLAGA